MRVLHDYVRNLAKFEMVLFKLISKLAGHLGDLIGVNNRIESKPIYTKSIHSAIYQDYSKARELKIQEIEKMIEMSKRT